MRNKFYILLCTAWSGSFGFNHLYACATCLCGDPTLTFMGTEKPFPNRLRIATELSYRSEQVGIEGINHRDIEELRLQVGLAYTLSERLSLAVRWPWVHKQLHEVNLAHSDTHHLGDAEISAKFFAYQDRQMRPRHLAGFLGGIRLPTATEQSAQGQTLDLDVQAGAGNWLIHGGGWYGQYRYPWFFHASSVVREAINNGFQEFSEGTAVLTTLLAQYAYSPHFAVQGGLDSRWSQKHRYAGESDPNSGGWIVFFTPGVVLHLAEDLLLNLSIQWPLVKQLHGQHQEETTFQIGLVYDF